MELDLADFDSFCLSLSYGYGVSLGNLDNRDLVITNLGCEVAVLILLNELPDEAVFVGNENFLGAVGCDNLNFGIRNRSFFWS